MREDAAGAGHGLRRGTIKQTATGRSYEVRLFLLPCLPVALERSGCSLERSHDAIRARLAKPAHQRTRVRDRRPEAAVDEN